jgi:uncharacterized protein (DUF1499 family)
MKWLVAIVLLPIVLGLGAILLNRPPLFEPPGVWQRLMLYLRTNVAETRSDQSRPELRPRHYARSVEALQRLTRDAMVELGWRVSDDEPGGRLKAEVSTPLLRFTDDVEVWFEPDPSGAWVGVRSASRIGRADLAANTRHVLDLYSALDRRLESP